jgi:hypothetical protein
MGCTAKPYIEPLSDIGFSTTEKSIAIHLWVMAVILHGQFKVRLTQGPEF